jgi:subtilisin-like proprotein convertase family protein
MADNTPSEVEIEATFNYRGDVTLTLCSGEQVEGYVSNRTATHVDVLVAGQQVPQTIAIADLTSITFSGVDHAAGKSYQEWLAKKAVGDHS